MSHNANQAAEAIERMIEAKIAQALRQLHQELAAAGVRGSFRSGGGFGPSTSELAMKLSKLESKP